MAHVDYNSKYRRDRKASGLCVTCGAKVKKGTLCEKHRRENLESQRILRHKRIAAGLCPRCDNPIEPGKSHCREHLDAVAAWGRDKRAARRAAGLCTRCGNNPRVPGIDMCKPCKETVSQYQMERNMRRKAEAALPVRDEPVISLLDEIDDIVQFAADNDLDFDEVMSRLERGPLTAVSVHEMHAAASSGKYA